MEARRSGVLYGIRRSAARCDERDQRREIECHDRSNEGPHNRVRECEQREADPSGRAGAECHDRLHARGMIPRLTPEPCSDEQS
jgi:hypothetical protein